MFKLSELGAYKHVTSDKIRYRDLDRQGHMNNAVFSTFFETGRIEIFRDPQMMQYAPEMEFVIASTKIDFIEEITWPGEVQIGTSILKVGQSSIQILQSLFQNGKQKASAESVIVQISKTTRKSVPLSDDYKNAIKKYNIK